MSGQRHRRPAHKSKVYFSASTSGSASQPNRPDQDVWEVEVHVPSAFITDDGSQTARTEIDSNSYISSDESTRKTNFSSDIETDRSNVTYFGELDFISESVNVSDSNPTTERNAMVGQIVHAIEHALNDRPTGITAEV